MKILYATAEVVPFSKTGGLADVAGSLPKSISKLGYDIRVVTPLYSSIDIKKFKLKKIAWNIPIQIGSYMENASLYEGIIPDSNVVIYFVESQKYFGRSGLYQENGVDYPDNCERFSFFSKAVCEFIKSIGWIPDILHCNDWQTGLIIPLFKLKYNFTHTASLYSIHNIGYLGLFEKEKIEVTGFSWEMFTFDKFEFWGKISLAKAGMVFATAINTVSEKYAEEIQTAEFGFGLDGLLQSRKNSLYGILNGIDEELWDPTKDTKIAKQFYLFLLHL